MKDPYQVLGVVKTAAQDEIKAAYRNLAKKIHPDLNPGNKVAEEKFKDASVAYEQIGTVDARAKYDRGETQAQQQEQQRASQSQRGAFYHQTQQNGGRYSYSFGQDTDSEGFYENLFQRHSASRKDFPGEDHLYQMSVSFKDAVLGSEREITLPNGKRLHVKIPPGVESGTKLRFKGHGGLGVGQGSTGDAYVEITVTPLAGFRRVGSDIETDIPVSFIEAILGAEIKVPTLDGFVMLKIPAGVSTGSRLRVRGKGVAIEKAPGDQIVILKVVMPKKVDPELEAVLKNWNGKYSYNPREAL